MSSDIIVTVQDVDVFATVQVQEEQLVTAESALYNPVVVQRLADIQDVDTTTLVNGSVLVYKASTNKWTSTTTLDLQNMEGGEY